MELGKKKLIYILNHYSVNSSEHFFHVINLLEEIANNGVELLLIIEKSDGEPLMKNSNIKVVCLKSKKVNRLIELYVLLGKAQKENYNKVFSRISTWATVTCIFKSFFSKLEVYYWHSGTVFEYDDSKPFNFSKVKWYFKTRLPFNFIKRNVTHFVTGPESMKDYYTENVGVDRKKIKILYNDIDVSRFSMISQEDKEMIKADLKIELNHKVVLFVHNFSPVRKTKFYVKKFLQSFFLDPELACQNFKFYFIGGGSDRNEIESQVREMGLGQSVIFLGSQPNSKVHQYYQVADIFINPTGAEGFPRVLIEAMACGLPIVTTNAGGIKDILGEKQLNYMSDISEAGDFADNLKKMAKLSSIELESIKNENLMVIKKFSTESVARMYTETIFEN
ncbi:glycosyltransferase [Flavobacterium sp. RSSB_23]|uniref:glycosyltransferase n=1 Tax=Flavobacterium sp. RSSB_23 TaxID=3447668 RepID=UPI003F3D27B0